MQNHPWYFFFFFILWIFLEQKLYTTDIFRILMQFLRVNVTFHDAVNVIHHMIKTAYSFPYTDEFKFVGVRNNKTQQIKC